MKKVITVGVLGTERCDTGCSHCSFNSCPKGEDMPLEAVKKLKESIKSFKGEVRVVFTGKGEPLKWQHLPESISILKGLPKVSFALVTSGCLNKKDDRYAVLCEAFKVEDLIYVNHSFNLFSPSFPARLAFTLPVVLQKSRYVYSHIKLVSGVSINDGTEVKTKMLIPEVTLAFEQALEQAVGKCSRLVDFPAKLYYLPQRLTPVLKGQRIRDDVESWLAYKSFVTDTVYRPYDIFLQDRIITAAGSLVFLKGRATMPATPETAYYNYSICHYCCGYSDKIDLSPRGEFIFCPYRPDFPPFTLGEVGGSLEKAILTKRKLAYEWLNLPRLEIAGDRSLHDPCDNCVSHAWEVFSEKGYAYLS